MSFTDDFLVAIARHLDTSGAGVYKTAAYAAADTAIVFGSLPDQPDAAIALNTYGVADDPATDDDVIGLQVRMRAPGRDVTVGSIDDAVFDALHALHDIDLPVIDDRTVHASLILSRSATPAGVDGNRRREFVRNFYCTVWRPASHRP